MRLHRRKQVGEKIQPQQIKYVEHSAARLIFKGSSESQPEQLQQPVFYLLAKSSEHYWEYLNFLMTLNWIDLPEWRLQYRAAGRTRRMIISSASNWKVSRMQWMNCNQRSLPWNVWLRTFQKYLLGCITMGMQLDSTAIFEMNENVIAKGTE